MNAWPDAPQLRAFLARASRRLGWITAAESAAVGLAVALVIAGGNWLNRGPIDRSAIAGIALALIGAFAGLLASFARRRSREPIARVIEHRAPECRNVIVTAAELIDAPSRVRSYVGEMVCREATRTASRLDPSSLFPAGRAIAALSVTAGLWLLTLGLIAARPPATRGALASSASAAISGVEVTIIPPAYTGRPTQSLHDPARVEALAGSRIRLAIRGTAASMTMETLAGRQSLSSNSSGVFLGEIGADADGYIAIQPSTSSGSAGTRRLIGVSVTADQPPRVRLTAPGRDLFIRDSNRTIDLAVDADDDIGLASLQLHYTKVSGSGEQFTFTEGQVPLDITRTDSRNWKARATWHLGALGLSVGDMVVYRGVAADGRPGATPVESDSYIVEITSPGSEAAEGFAADDQFDKYALSEQMVILKTQQLIARRASIPADSAMEASLGLAAEQRGVRAVFVFMMGGELSDEGSDVSADPTTMGQLHEEGEAAGESDLAAGRMANQGRIALVQALRSMSQAATSLNTADLTPALDAEKAALTSLQGAFSRTRYILRALTQREALDLSRRMSGVLTTAGRDVGPSVEAASDPRLSPLRHALAGIASLAGQRQFSADASAAASSLAESVLRVDPSAEPLQHVAADLTHAAAAIRVGEARSEQTQQLLDSAATSLAAAVRGYLLDAPRGEARLDLGRLNGALTDALRHPKGSQ